MSDYRSKFALVPAVYVVLRRGNEILLLRRANTGYRDGYYALPAGHIDGNEPARQAAVREVREEVGVDISEADLHFVHVLHRRAEDGNHERVDFFFETTKWQGEPHNAEPAKCDDVQWFALDKLPKNTTPITKHVLAQIAEGNHYSHHNF